MFLLSLYSLLHPVVEPGGPWGADRTSSLGLKRCLAFFVLKFQIFSKTELKSNWKKYEMPPPLGVTLATSLLITYKFFFSGGLIVSGKTSFINLLYFEVPTHVAILNKDLPSLRNSNRFRLEFIVDVSPISVSARHYKKILSSFFHPQWIRPICCFAQSKRLILNEELYFLYFSILLSFNVRYYLLLPLIIINVIYDYLFCIFILGSF